MLYEGDYVRHSVFPPVEGHVSYIDDCYGRNRIAVVYKGMNNEEVLYWDDEDTWELINREAKEDEDSNYIDVDFREV